MITPATRKRGVIFSAGAALICLWVIVGATSFQACVADTEQAQAGRVLEKHEPRYRTIYTDTVVHIRCVGPFLSENGEAITALATIVLAFFTFTLWSATFGLQQLGQRQSEDMKRSLKIGRLSAFAATRSAKAAKLSAEADQRNLAREEALFRMRVHAQIRLSLNFARDFDHSKDAPPTKIVIRSQNRGSGQGTLKEVMIRCSLNFDPVNEAPVPPADYDTHSTSELLSPLEFNSFEFTIPDRPDQYMYGFVRWQDVLGRHRYRFCMRVRRHKPSGARFNFFHEWGGNDWNREEPDPDPYKEQ